MAVGTITSDRCWQRDDGATGHRRWWQMQEVVTVRDDEEKLSETGNAWRKCANRSIIMSMLVARDLFSLLSDSVWKDCFYALGKWITVLEHSTLCSEH
jgi:hypothetical protein